MNAIKILVAGAALAASFAPPAGAACERGFSLQVLLDGSPRPEYHARGAVYVEALRGREYALRITNPLPVRVAVALAVDGLDTIDATHGPARTAAKWVLDPYETIEISGWQTNGHEARRFYFTGERSSYGAWLGQTDNLGVIEAVFYREKPRPIPVRPMAAPPTVEPRRGSAGEETNAEGRAGGMPGTGSLSTQSRSKTAKPEGLSDGYAATGIGARTRHDVEWVHFQTEDTPAARIRIRYEFHEELARLGVLPPGPDPLVRREAARGFSGGFCPAPPELP
jgi:hypothetical protein